MNFFLSLLAIIISLVSVLNTPKEKLGIATIVPVQQGGSGTTTLSINSVVLGNGTGSLFASSSPSLGALYATTTATSTLFRGINIEGGCFSILGNCVANSSGITSLNTLTGASQTFSAQGPLAIGSAGTVHTFIASSSPSFGEVRASTTLAVATTTLGSAFIVGIHGDVLIAGSTTVKGLLATSTIEALQLRVSGAATSTFVGGITSAGTGNFTGGLMLANALNNTSAATSAFTGTITSSGLSSSGGITNSSGSILNTSGATSTWSGGLSVTSLRVSSGLHISDGSLLITSTATSTWSGGLLTTSATHTSGLTISGGSLLITSTASSSFSGGLSVSSLASSGGLTLTGGGISALSYTGLFGTIGIGTATPSQILGVQGDALIAGTTTVKGIFATSTVETLSIKTTGAATNTFAGGIQFTGTANVCTSGGACLGGGGGAASLFTDGGATTYLTSTDNLGVASSSVDTRFGIGTYGLLVSGTSTLGSLWATSSTVYIGSTSTPYKFPDFITASGTVLKSNGVGDWRGYFEDWQLLATCSVANASAAGTLCDITGLPLRKFYHLNLSVVGLSTAAIVGLRFNADAGANYGYSDVLDNAAAESSASDSACNFTGTSNRSIVGSFFIDISGGTNQNPGASIHGLTTSGAAVPVKYESGCTWNSSAGINEIEVRATQSATFNAGSRVFIWASRE